MQPRKPQYKTKEVTDSKDFVQTMYQIGDNLYTKDMVDRHRKYTTRNLLRYATSLNENPNNNRLTKKFQREYNMLMELSGDSSRIKVDSKLGEETRQAVRNVRKIKDELSSDAVFNRLLRLDEKRNLIMGFE